MHLILLGIQGSGKGTQARLLLEHGYKLFETGAQLRLIAKEDSDLGKEVKSIIESGNLVSDELVCRLAANFIDSNKGSRIIFDGIPRNIQQFNAVVPMLQEKNLEFSILNFELDKQTAIERMLKRAEIENRTDDTPEIMEKRIEIFQNDTLPLLDEFRKITNVFSVDASQSIEKVNQDVHKALNL
jgi:adenylate kinase